MKPRSNGRVFSASMILVLVTSLLVGGAIVAGAHGGGPSGRVIHACVDDRSGAVEIVNANAHCGPDATALDWNSKGRQGPQGNRGPAGPSGPGLGNLEVVTATSNQTVTVTSQGDVPAFATGVGVDCPGEAIATGGGGSTGSTNQVNSLVSSVPLEDDSTGNTAEAGDTPTGWFAWGTFPVTVYAICADVEGGPPDEDG